MMSKYKIGFAPGVFDLFHIGHLNLLRRAKENCGFLIAGVCTDELAISYKNKRPVIPFEERIQIVESIKYVDTAVPELVFNKVDSWRKYKFNVIFIGDDWKGTDKWNKIEYDMKLVGVEVVYFPYTQKTSSTLLNRAILELIK